jgi:hypothetical protein
MYICDCFSFSSSKQHNVIKCYTCFVCVVWKQNCYFSSSTGETFPHSRTRLCFVFYRRCRCFGWTPAGHSQGINLPAIFALWKLERNLFFFVTGAPPNARFSEPHLQRDVSLLQNNHRKRIGESSL